MWHDEVPAADPTEHGKAVLVHEGRGPGAQLIDQDP